MECDVLVIGAGAAGCALAGRLAEDVRTDVLLVEAGGRAWRPVQQVPKGFLWAMRDPRLAYHYPAGSETWLRGKGIGGSTAINGMMYVCGDPADYDALEAAGNPGWGWSQVGRILRELEGDPLRDEAAGRGSGAALRVRVGRAGVAREPVSQAVLAAAEQIGIPPVADVNAATGARIGFTPSTIHRGRRVSAATLLRAGHRTGRLRILSGAQAGLLLYDSPPVPGRPRVIGARIRQRGRLVDVRARREVVVSCGAIESVLLLERSGIGDPRVLHGLGIAPRVEAPMLGTRLVEQRSVTVKARLRDRIGLKPQLGTRRGLALSLAQYATTLGGPVAAGPYELCGMLALESGSAARVDTQLLCTALATDDTGLTVADYPGLMLQGYRIRPTTYSTVHAGGSHPDAPPVIDAHYLQTPDDRAAAAAILAWQRELLATEPLAGLIAEEVNPGPGIATLDEIADYTLASGVGIFHAVGSTAMGPKDTDVVDVELRVRGVDGLRVADAGVLPFPVAGGTAAPAMVVGRRAAELILDG